MIGISRVVQFNCCILLTNKVDFSVILVYNHDFDVIQAFPYPMAYLLLLRELQVCPYRKGGNIAGQINPIFHNNCAFSDASMKLGRNTHVGHLLQ